MSTIKINSQHRGNLDLADIQNIKTNAKEGDTVKFGSVFGKEYSVTALLRKSMELNPKLTI